MKLYGIFDKDKRDEYEEMIESNKHNLNTGILDIDNNGSVIYKEREI